MAEGRPLDVDEATEVARIEGDDVVPSGAAQRALARGQKFGRPQPKEVAAVAWKPCPPEERVPLSEVRIRKTRQCHFKAKEGGKRGCARCGENKGWLGHLGAPKSVNAFGSSANPHAYQGDKERWQNWIIEALEEAGLPKGLGSVYAQITICFGDRTKRDQGNFRAMVEKALGDALQLGGWLKEDDWDRFVVDGPYRADPLSAEPQRFKGENWTEIVLFPEWPRDPAESAGQASLL
ncbi:MAG TPA: hypothetical protein VF192_01145 [Longimicrobiales bacterium]